MFSALSAGTLPPAVDIIHTDSDSLQFLYSVLYEVLLISAAAAGGGSVINIG